MRRAAGALLAAGACAAIAAGRGGETAALPAGARADGPGRDHGREQAGFGRRDVPGRPVRLRIPALRVDAAVVRLGRDARGRLETPADPDDAGWWAGGARPGARGPAVLAGHVDSRTGPGVFARLRHLRRGDAIVVADHRGRRHRFTVRRVEEHPKAAFPTARVYGPAGRRALRLVSCTGAFDRARGHYRDNLVVFAT